MRINRIAAGTVLVLLSLAGSVRADGTTDLNLDPTATTIISVAGSYRLVADVIMTANVSAVSITAGNVTLDLNGHTITGTGAVSGNGIVVTGTNVTIQNGAVANFYIHGIASAVNGTTIRNVTVTGNRGSGILLTAISGLVEDCKATGNNTGGDFSGISVFNSSTVRRCVASDNDSTSNGVGTTVGISGGADCTITDNRCLGNDAGSAGATAAGISVSGNGALISGNVCNSNTATGTASGYGILVSGSGAGIVNNVCRANVGGTNVMGISAGAGSRITGNTCEANILNAIGTGTAYGILAGSGCEITGNACRAQTGGSTVGSALGISAGTGSTIADNTSIGQRGTGTGVARGITALSGCTIINNTASDNDAGANGATAHGILATSNCRIAGNTCTGNNEGSTTSGTSHGIEAATSTCLVENNVCSGNNSNGTGAARGISVAGGTTVRGNTCDSNTGTTTSYGISVNSAGCAIEENQCSNNTGGSGIGIFIGNFAGNVVRANRTASNGSIGISWAAAGLAGRSELNRMDEGAVVNPPTSVGAGDLADIVY